MGDPAVVPGTHKTQPGDIIQLYAMGLGPIPSGIVLAASPVPITGVDATNGTVGAVSIGRGTGCAWTVPG
jgi:hypothetical protein